MNSTTGDVLMTVQRLVDALHALSYHRTVSARRLTSGDPTELLPILHFALLDFSPHVAAFVSARGFVLYAKDDAAFTDAVFRLAQLHLSLHPALQARQFLSRGFIGE
jgi:centrosomal protein CEP44